MGNKAMGNKAMGNKEGARQSDRPVVVCPDKTIDLSRSVSVSPNVRFTGEYVFLLSSTVIDGKDSCVPIESSTTVRCNGKYVIRDGDKFLVNGSCIGVLVYVEGEQKAESLQENTTPPAEDAGFFDWIAGQLGDAVDTAKELNDEYAIATRLEGAAEGVFGVVEIVGGAIGVVAPEPVTSVGGALLFVNGIDNAGTGFSQLWTGQSGQTLLDQAVMATANAVGVSQETAQMAQSTAGMLSNPAKIITKADDLVGAAAGMAKKKKKAPGKTKQHKGEDGVRVTQRVTRLKGVKVKCFNKKNPKSSAAEYDRQLKDQQAGLNNMTAEEYLEGRKAYTGKRKSTVEDRANFKKKLAEKYGEQYRASGMSSSEAKALGAKDAAGSMKSLDALHSPDLFAGGADIISGFGDRGVNRSIGSQWKDRVGAMDKAAQEAIGLGTGKKRMNVKLTRCK